MIVLLRGLAAAVLALALAAVPAGAATVTVRVEGAQRTITRATQVQTSPSVVVDKRSQGGTTCEGTTAAGALELATAGDWGGRADNFGQRVERIAGETYLLGDEFSGRFWSIWVNNTTSSAGICAFSPQEGDEILLAPACGGATDNCFSDPLDLRAPATARPGEAVAVDVDEYTNTFDDQGTAHAAKTPSSGATVTGGGQTATTGADGRATLTLTERGPVELVVTKGDRVRDEATVCVTDGADSQCGSPAPCATDGHDGRCGSRDTDVAEATITGVREGQRFAAGRGPRTLSGKVASDPSGLLAVKLRLTRNDRGHCSYFSGKTERFRPSRCGATHGRWFAIGDRADWSYLLPANLPRGRYVLDVNAIDKAYNRDDTRRRGANRVVFVVA